MRLHIMQLLGWACLIAIITLVSAGSDRKLLQLSLAELTAVAAGHSGSSRLADLKAALREVGGLAVTGLQRPDYSLAVQQLPLLAPACLLEAASSLETEVIKDVRLEDGTRRISLVRMESSEEESSEEESSDEEASFEKNFSEEESLEKMSAGKMSKKDWPACLMPEMTAVTSTFDQVERILTAALGRLLGNQTLLVATSGTSSRPAIRSLPELASKTHLHVYKPAEEDTVEVEEVGELLSMPYHLDNGVYLLLTPSRLGPLRLKSRSGRLVRTDAVPEDAVIFLLGRGLTDWLLQATNGVEGEEYRHLVPALHAVPSLRGTAAGTTMRTVVARMRVAPMAAVPASFAAASGRPQLTTFGDIFLDGKVRPSAASLCYYGGPLNLAEDRRRGRRHTADCWPHTEKC
jgi:hypothetical protein